MSEEYRRMSLSDLRDRWERLRVKVGSGNGVARDVDELYSLRREIDRRSGEKNPIIEVNFEDYVKD